MESAALGLFRCTFHCKGGFEKDGEIVFQKKGNSSGLIPSMMISLGRGRELRARV
jgi:hypothetical protein